MKRYGVKEVTKLSGVSVRTLHHYDKIGLLKPAMRAESGYRYYGEQELLRLQQILFYKELDFPLKEIIELLDEPDFDLIEALKSHKQALKARRRRISQLLATIDNTIDHLQNETIMTNPEELYEGMPKEMGTTYRQKAIDEYGEKAIKRSEESLLKLGKDGFARLKQAQQQNTVDLFALREEAPDSPAVQELIAQHYEIIRAFWGTTESEDQQAEAYAGLGQLYLHDERYTRVDGEPQPKFASFLQQAMQHFADTELGINA